MGNRNVLIRIGQCAKRAFLAAAVSAAQGGVVTDNNLSASSLEDFASNNSATSLAFTVRGPSLCALQGWFRSTATGYDIAPYYIAGVSAAALPTNAAQLSGSLSWGRTYGQVYSNALKTLRFSSPAGSDTMYFSLGLGRFDSWKSANYSWAATNVWLYSAAGADTFAVGRTNYGPNLVPNASFEVTNVSFWSTGTAVPDTGKHGSYVWQVPSSAEDGNIGIPVVTGVRYLFSFWSASPSIGSGHQIEYGFSVPQNGWATGSGNTAIPRYLGGGAVPWTEYTGTFVPGEGQTIFYIGGMANGGILQFDSVFVGAQIVPPKGTCVSVR